jgi:hypothetical protein
MDSKDVIIGLDQYWLDGRILMTNETILSRDNDRDGAGEGDKRQNRGASKGSDESHGTSNVGFYNVIKRSPR